MDRSEKAEVIKGLNQKANKASIALVTDFRGLKVEEMEELRAKLREQSIDFQVVKNTLARIALQETPHETIKDNFQDCCALAFGYDDPVIAAKVLSDFAKKNKKFQMRFGSHNGQYLTSENIETLSKLPSREQLLSQMLSAMNAVPSNFVGLFANLLRNLLYALNGIREQKEQG